MSDLYDSLEDESDDIKRSCDSLDEIRSDTPDLPKSLCKSKSLHLYPFYLNDKISKDNLSTVSYPSSAFTSAPNNSQEKNFLPQIKDKVNLKGQDSVQKLIVDNQILSKQGLQLNNDGSFTKSPRPEDLEELPFIAREYRDLQFVKQKITPTRKAPYVKNQNKNLFSFADNPVDGISMNALISARKKKGSSEEILVSEGSVSSAQSKPNKRLSKEQNLTDSMKERLLHRSSKVNQTNNSGMGNPKRREVTAQNNKSTHFKNLGTENPNLFPHKSPRERFVSDVGNYMNHKPRSGDRKILRHRSDFMVNVNKPKLNYSERLKLQGGYNPLHLRLGCLPNKTTDTNRSNFGDSMAEQLTGVSTRIQSVENLMNEDEEMYYRKLMEVDQKRRRKLARSSRSEGPAEFGNMKETLSNVYKTENKKSTEVRPNVKRKSMTKSLSLDIPVKSDSSDKFSKKSSHICLGGSSTTTFSKAELALKAKTYGYIVNARNIFKLKAQAENKSSGRNGKTKTEKHYPQADTTSGVRASKERIEKRISLPDALPKVRHSSFRVLQDFPKKMSPAESYPGTKASLVIKDSRTDFFLPEVRNLSSRCTKMKSEVMDGWGSCFKSPKR